MKLSLERAAQTQAESSICCWAAARQRLCGATTSWDCKNVLVNQEFKYFQGIPIDKIKLFLSSSPLILIFLFYLFVLLLTWHLEITTSTCMIFFYLEMYEKKLLAQSCNITPNLSWASPSLQFISSFSGVKVFCKSCSRQISSLQFSCSLFTSISLLCLLVSQNLA